VIDLGEYARLLGYPYGRELEGDVLVRARESIAWYERHGRPHVCIRDGVAAFTAGYEIEREVERRWAEDRVDEAYFLDRLGAVVVEQLARAHPHESPGTGTRPLEEQFDLVARLGPEAPLDILPSGMLRPVNSLVAVLTDDATSCSDCGYPCVYRRVG